MAQASQLRTYDPATSIVFLKTKERFGGLSNMAAGFPLRVSGICIRTSEALYQACRFPHMPQLQRRIIDERSPMTAKMRGKPFRKDSRPDWDSVRVKIMRWCLRVKLAQNWHNFSNLLFATGCRPIVEKSRKDDFWGAKVAEDSSLVGMNVLGRLLMELREQMKIDQAESLQAVQPLLIPEFLLFQKPIETVYADEASIRPARIENRPAPPLTPPPHRELLQPSLFDQPLVVPGQMDFQRNNTPAETKPTPGLPAYPSYKPAHIHWLGKIPSHWQEKRGKSFFREIDERTVTGEEELLSVSHTTGVTPRSQKNVTMFKAESYVGHKIARPNDIVINTMWAWMSALGVSKNVGIVSPAYGVYRPLNEKDFLPYYLSYLLRTPMLRWEYTCRSTGIRASRLRLYPDKFLNIVFPCPPLAEQDRMVAFLRAKEWQVRRLIRKKRKLTEIASERLKLVTHNAMNSPDAYEVPLEVVAHFKSRAVNRTASENYTPIGLYNRGRGLFKKPETPGNELGASDFFWVKSGDLILSGQFAWEGAVALAEDDADGCTASHRYPILRGVEGIADTAYLLAYFRSDYGNLLLNIHSRGAAGRNRPLNVRSLRKEKISIPPPDAQATVRYFVELEASIRRKFILEHSKIMEYRERLIADVVTGKLDVRHIEIGAPADEPTINDAEHLEEELQTDDADMIARANAYD